MTEGMKIRYKRMLMDMTMDELTERCLLSKQVISYVELDKKHGIKDSAKKLINYELAKAFMEWDPSTQVEKMLSDAD